VALERLGMRYHAGAWERYSKKRYHRPTLKHENDTIIFYSDFDFFAD
jgi:hypothetical protein